MRFTNDALFGNMNTIEGLFKIGFFIFKIKVIHMFFSREKLISLFWLLSIVGSQLSAVDTDYAAQSKQKCVMRVIGQLRW